MPTGILLCEREERKHQLTHTNIPKLLSDRLQRDEAEIFHFKHAAELLSGEEICQKFNRSHVFDGRQTSPNLSECGRQPGKM